MRLSTQRVFQVWRVLAFPYFRYKVFTYQAMLSKYAKELTEDKRKFGTAKYTRRHLILEVFRFFIFFKKFLYFLLTMLTTYAWVDRILFLVENVSNALTCRLRFHWITRHSESNLQVKIFWLLTWLATTIVSLNLKF